jgi:hypothetical protein
MPTIKVPYTKKGIAFAKKVKKMWAKESKSGKKRRSYGRR